MSTNDYDSDDEPILDIDEQPTGCGSSKACDPNSTLHRFLMLPFICLLGFGSYFCFDNPAAIEEVFLKVMDIDQFRFGLLYTMYSMPNIVLSTVGGFLVDRVFGIRLGAIIFSAFILVGQLLLSLGAFIDSLYLMYFARFIFGIGGESLAVCQNAYAASWYTQNELNFIFGLQLSVSRLGSTANMNLLRPIYDSIDESLSGNARLGFTLLIASAFCVFSFILVIVLGLFDKRAKRILKKEKSGASDINLKIVLKFPFSFWMLCGVCVFYYSAVFPFVSLGKLFYIRRYDYSSTRAQLLNSILFFISVPASPLSGLLVNYLGFELYFQMAVITLSFLCHATMALVFVVPPEFIMVVFGCSYAILASVLWPMVAKIIRMEHLATAYGIMQSVQNAGLAVAALVAGIVVDSFGYFYLLIFFMSSLSIAAGFNVLIYVKNNIDGGNLNMSGFKRRRNEKEKKIVDLLTSQSIENPIS